MTMESLRLFLKFHTNLNLKSEKEPGKIIKSY